MYIGCEHEGKDIRDVIRYRKAVDDVNRMRDDGTVREKPITTDRVALGPHPDQPNHEDNE